MTNKRPQFQRMWESSAMGVWAGELVAKNFIPENHIKKPAGMQEKNAIFYYRKGIGTQCFYNIDEMKASDEFGYKKYTSKERANDYLERSQKALRKGDKAYAGFLKTNLSKKSVTGLFKYYKEIIETFNEIYTYFHACQPQYFSRIEKEIQKYLTEEISSEKAGETYSLLTKPVKLDALREEEIAWLKIVREAQKVLKGETTLKGLKNHKEIFRKIKDHSDKYIFCGVVEVNTPWDIDYYVKLLNKDIRTNSNEKIKRITSQKDKIIKKKEEIIKKYSISGAVVEKCKTLGEVGHNRLSMRFGWTKTSYIYIEIIKEIATRNLSPNLNIKTIWDYKASEAEKVAKGGKTISREEIKKRGQAFLFYVKDGEVSFYSGDAAVKKKEELVPEEKLDVDEIKGAIGCKGKVRGKVIVFSWIEEDLTKRMEEMKEGSILVAGQTRPFLMSAVRKAKAIITDEGGITCHAAIVSRELNIPCVIGTKIATKVLKDGDLVEVDANKGVVRKLKRNK